MPVVFSSQAWICRCKIQTSLQRVSSQVVKDIIAEDGIEGFFKGWWAQIITGSSNFVYFYASCMIKVIVTTRYLDGITPRDLRHLVG